MGQPFLGNRDLGRQELRMGERGIGDRHALPIEVDSEEELEEFLAANGPDI